MTLDTNIYLLDPIDPKMVFNKMREIIGVPEDADYRYNENESWYGEGSRTKSIVAEPGQGYDAWLMVHYTDNDLPFLAGSLYDEVYDDEDENQVPEHYVRISVDTAYGYQGPNGESCGDLHASYIAALYEWAKANGSRISWMNEYEGKIYDGLDNLSSLGRCGDESRDWFKNIVTPAIMHHLEEEM